jgi:hypothetical protein
MSEFGEAADLARRAKALGVEEWELRMIEGSPDRKVSADIVADNIPSLRRPKLTDAQWAAKKKEVAAMDARAAEQREREARGQVPPVPSGWLDYGPLPAREAGHRQIDQLLDQQDFEWRKERAAQLKGWAG